MRVQHGSWRYRRKTPLEQGEKRPPEKYQLKKNSAGEGNQPQPPIYG
jgi:hypothetical protein